jgi:hypothetical protein
MSVHKEINSGKYQLGPGGMGCPCCTKCHPREQKRLAEKAYRKRQKQLLKKRMIDDETSGK